MGKSLEDKIVVIGHLICFERKIVSKNNEGTKEEIIFPKSSEELKNFIKIFRENHPELAFIDDVDHIDNNKDFKYIEINNCLINDEDKAKIYEVGIPVKGKVNIPTRRGFNFYIYGDCKLSQVFNQLPFGILNKNRTGVGATTLEIKSERNSIIVVPTKNLAFNKAQTGKGKYLYVGSAIKGKADSGTTKKDIIKYINNNSIPYKKIITVADSLKKVLGVLDYLKIDRNTYFLVVDEVDIIQSDSTFRPKLENVIDYYFTFGRENRALLSATIGEFSHPKVREEYMIDIDYQIPQKREINLCRTDNPNKLLCDLVLGIEGAGKIVIAYNSLTQIQIIIQLLQAYAIEKVEDKEEQKRIKQEIKDKCGILCSDASKNKVKEFYQELSMNEENKTLLPKEINFITCAFFVGIDIDEPFHLISVSNTHVPYTLLSPNKYTQIAGRGRQGILSEYIIYNVNEKNIDTHNLSNYKGKLVEKAKEVETLYEATKAICKRNQEMIPLCNKINNAIQSHATENVGDISIPLTYKDINGDYKISYFNIDALYEKKVLKNSLYAHPRELEQALLKEGHHVFPTYNSIPYSDIQKQIEKIVEDENSETLKEEMESAISELKKLEKENSLSDEVLEEYINNSSRGMKTFYERFKSLYKYIDSNILIDKLVKDEETLKGVDKDQYEQWYQSIIFWALDEKHTFKIAMKNTFLSGKDKRFTPDLIKQEMRRIYFDLGLKYNEHSIIALFRKFFDTSEVHNRHSKQRYYVVKEVFFDSLQAVHKEIIPSNEDITSLFKI